MDIENRTSFVASIGKFVTDAENCLTGCLDSLGWSREHVMKKYNESMVSCPLNQNHRMPATSLAKHLEACSWISEGYTHEEMESAVPSSEFFYQDATAVHPVIIDKTLLNQILSTSQRSGNQTNFSREASYPNKIVPRTANRAVTDFTADERWAIYDYVVAQGHAANKMLNIKPEDLQLEFGRREETFKEKSQLELMAEQRDYKRRRQSYRAKNVHITKKSYTEVMKEVIENHMQILLEKKTEIDSTSPEPEDDLRTSRRDTERNSAGAASFNLAELRETSCEGGDGLSRKRERHHHRSEDKSDKRQRRHSRDDSSHHHHKRRRSPSSVQQVDSIDRISNSNHKHNREGHSHRRHHHHKKSSHKSPKRHRHSPSRQRKTSG